MFINGEDIEFTKEQEDRLKTYLGEDWLKELNGKVNIYDEEASIDVQINHVLKYILNYCKSYDDDNKESIDNFFDLLEHYRTKTFREPIRDENGVIQLFKSGFNSGNAFYTGKIKTVKAGSGKGAYVEGIYISPNRKEFIKKFSMDAKGQMQNYKHHTQSRYNGVIAHEVFEYFGEKSASYLAAITKPPYYFLITENFLSNNQELITLEDFYLTEPEFEYRHHSDILELIKSNIFMRYRRAMEEENLNSIINKLKFQYSKQALLKRIIGLKDEKLGNIGIILTTNTNESQIPEVDISPAFDLDLSFNFAEECEMAQKHTDSGEVDIRSFIKEFANTNGFREFVESIVRKVRNEDLAAETIINNAYNASKAKFFIDENNRKDYSDFLKARFRETRQAYNEIYIRSDKKGEDEYARTILD